MPPLLTWIMKIKVDQKLTKIIDAATKSAISKQELMTAQQQTLTAKAKGEQALVEIEYQQKQEQTKSGGRSRNKSEGCRAGQIAAADCLRRFNPGSKKDQGIGRRTSLCPHEDYES
jgi:hypothetical protein